MAFFLSVGFPQCAFARVGWNPRSNLVRHHISLAGGGKPASTNARCGVTGKHSRNPLTRSQGKTAAKLRRGGVLTPPRRARPRTRPPLSSPPSFLRTSPPRPIPFPAEGPAAARPLSAFVQLWLGFFRSFFFLRWRQPVGRTKVQLLLADFPRFSLQKVHQSILFDFRNAFNRPLQFVRTA